MDLRVAIFRALRDSRAPLTLAGIRKKIGHSAQATAYQLDCMVKCGVALKEDGHYTLQAFLKNNEIEGDLFEFFAARLNESGLNLDGTEQMATDAILAGLRLFFESFLHDASRAISK